MFKSQFGTDGWEMAEEEEITPTPDSPNTVINKDVLAGLMRDSSILCALLEEGFIEDSDIGHITIKLKGKE